MHSHPIAKSLSCDFATSKIFANFTINDDRRKQELQTTQPQKKTVNRYDSYFTKRKNGLSVEDKEKWRAISIRINQISVEIKDLRQKNILEAGK